MFFIYMAVVGTPILAIVFCLNLALVIEKSSQQKPIQTNTFIMTAAFTCMVTCITIALLTVLDGA